MICSEELRGRTANNLAWALFWDFFITNKELLTKWMSKETNEFYEQWFAQEKEQKEKGLGPVRVQNE